MISARQPERIETLHPSPTHNDVMQCVDEHVPHVQRARYVGGGDHNHKGGPGGMDIGYEKPSLFPERAPFVFNEPGVVALGKVQGVYRSYTHVGVGWSVKRRLVISSDSCEYRVITLRNSARQPARL